MTDYTVPRVTRVRIRVHGSVTNPYVHIHMRVGSTSLHRSRVCVTGVNLIKNGEVHEGFNVLMSFPVLGYLGKSSLFFLLLG